ncbi:hypothetical protein IV203_008390 [Nitzschia inconspicua]|uniref:Uncharacterized protein n=1 Tax=Nitzschia inconspicua TaxID=303405 RepID=A0A9K3KZB3_9STRA|nr:hypothetical protein IV203_008390 [Nitzschia inconspicua]
MSATLRFFYDLDVCKDARAVKRICSGSDAKRSGEVLENCDKRMSVVSLGKFMGALVTQYMQSGMNAIIRCLRSVIGDMTWDKGSTMDVMFQDEEKLLCAAHAKIWYLESRIPLCITRVGRQAIFKVAKESPQ